MFTLISLKKVLISVAQLYTCHQFKTPGDTAKRVVALRKDQNTGGKTARRWGAEGEVSVRRCAPLSGLWRASEAIAPFRVRTSKGASL